MDENREELIEQKENFGNEWYKHLVGKFVKKHPRFVQTIKNLFKWIIKRDLDSMLEALFERNQVTCKWGWKTPSCINKLRMTIGKEQQFQQLQQSQNLASRFNDNKQ